MLSDDDDDKDTPAPKKLENASEDMLIKVHLIFRKYEVIDAFSVWVYLYICGGGVGAKVNHSKTGFSSTKVP